MDAHGRVFVADTGNRRVRVIVDGEVHTIAGDGSTAIFDSPATLALSADGRIIFVGDEYGYRIRTVSAASP